jgi:hypothetical protein
MFKTLALLTASNFFMTFAWYGHLKYKEQDLWKVILVSWIIAFFEYCLQVPANRVGSNYFSLFQLKTLQEVISLSVFAIFAVYYMQESLKWNYIVAFLCLVLAVFFMFKKWEA